jgi:hypothetical protein
MANKGIFENGSEVAKTPLFREAGIHEVFALQLLTH